MPGKKGKYTFIVQDNGVNAKASIVISLISAALMGILILIAFLVQGQAGMAIGAVGLIGALLAVYAFILGMRALVRRECDFRLASVSGILSGILVIFWLALVLLGLH